MVSPKPSSRRWPWLGEGKCGGRAAPVSLVAVLLLLLLGWRTVARDKLMLDKIRSSSGAYGACMRATHVLSWDGKPYPIVVDGVCDGGDEMRILSSGMLNGSSTASQRRLSPVAEADYTGDCLRAGAIEGWMRPEHIQYVKILTRMQHSLQILGSVGEIGVYRGRFYIALAGFALQAEPIYAMDLFDELKNLNVDGSGIGVSRNQFLSNLERYGIKTKELRLLKGDSNLLTVQNFTQRSVPLFRMLSIDGSHTLEATLHDLTLASCIVRDGGIVVVDDIENIAFFGVVQAVVHFSTQGILYPFLLAQNKMYLTTRSHHQMYLNFVARAREFPCQGMHASRRSVGHIAMCIVKK